MNVGPIASREVGYYPLSMATSLALEGAMGNHPDPARQTGKVELLKYDVIWVNLKTVFRNFFNAMDRQQAPKVPARDMAQGILQELEQLENVLSQLSSGRMQVQYYVSDYAGMDTKYRHARIRGYVTELQRAYGRSLEASLTQVIKELKDRVKIYRLKITDEEARPCLLLTHYAYDLLVRNFRQFCLLESHTGAVKDKLQFYTKYLNGKDLAQIPFCEGFMQVFGDSEHFHPMQISIRKQILELADKYHWSQVTTRDKVLYGLKQLQDPYLRDQLDQVFHA